MSRAGAAERGFTLLELLVVLVVMGLLAGVMVPRFRSLGQPSLERTAGNLVSELRLARTMALRSGRLVRVTGDELRARLPAGVTLEEAGGEAPLFFLPDGRSGGGRLVLSDAREQATVTVDWLTGAVRLAP